jgi:hypothetical protein
VLSWHFAWVRHVQRENLLLTREAARRGLPSSEGRGDLDTFSFASARRSATRIADWSSTKMRSHHTSAATGAMIAAL